MKPSLVLLSGLLSNATLWQHQVRHLSDIATVHVISPSQNAPEKMVGAILEQAPTKFALAGHSMGGWLCLEVMRIAPSRVTQLCLLNTTARIDSEEKRARREQMIQKVKQGQFKEIVGETVQRFVFNPLVKTAVETMFLEVGEEVFIRQEQAMLERRDIQAILPKVNCPTLVIHAAQDKNFSHEESMELARGIQNAKFALVEDAGHMSPMEMPQAITALLRFWLSYP